MTKNNNDTKFNESCKFILTNLDITTDQLTDDQLDCWSVKDEGDSQEQFDIFMFAHTMFTLRKQGHGKFNLNIKEIDTKFEIYKTIITIEILSRKTPINSQKRKIFDFDSYESTIKFNFGNMDNIINATK